MGSSTYFDGHFNLDKQPSDEIIERLEQLAEDRQDGPEFPSYYCGWILEGMTICHDGGEKFSMYVEWLTYIIDKVMKPAGIKLTGSVLYTGDDGDSGRIVVADDQHVRLESTQTLADELDDLRAFKAFAMTIEDDIWQYYQDSKQ